MRVYVRGCVCLHCDCVACVCVAVVVVVVVVAIVFCRFGSTANIALETFITVPDVRHGRTERVADSSPWKHGVHPTFLRLRYTVAY